MNAEQASVIDFEKAVSLNPELYNDLKDKIR